MSIFNIFNITPAGALCNAMAAAKESERRAAGSRPSPSVEMTVFAPATIWNFLGDALRQIGLTYRTETV